MKYIHLFLLLTLAVLQTSCGSVDDSAGDSSSGGTSTPNTIDEAISSGTVGTLSEEQFLKAAVDAIDGVKTHLSADKYKIFNLNTDGSEKSDGSSLTSIDWRAIHSALIKSDFDKSSGILYVNSDHRSSVKPEVKEIASIGKTKNSRFMAMGGNPMRTYKRFPTEMNEQMHRFMENSLAWITQRDNLKQKPFNVVIAQLDGSYYAPDRIAVRLWLDARYAGLVKYNDEQSCDNTKLSSCLTKQTDLLIISQHINDGDNEDTIIAGVNKALQQGIGVLFMNKTTVNNKYTYKLLFDMFGVRYDVSNRYETKDFNPLDYINKIPADLAKIRIMFNHFIKKDYQFDWTKCKDKNGTGATGPQYSICSKEVPKLISDFEGGAREVRITLNRLDKNNIAIFDTSAYKFEKLLVLLGDKLRQKVTFPMDKINTDDNILMRSLYSDSASYIFRKINPKQPDMGNFSKSDFSSVTPITKTVNLISKKNFRSTGAYALPGQTVEVTRKDTADVNVKVFINTLRSGATHEYRKKSYRKDEYTRPKYTQSERMEILPGETISFTSSYGGPIQLQFDKNDLAISVEFKNVGEHPYWKSSADDITFEKKINEGVYNWAEIVTSGFEVHSRLDKMKGSIAIWGTAANLAKYTVKYTSNYPHVLAGFKGVGIDVIPEIHDWANDRNLSITTLDSVKHMNSDQALCGGACSGNPYDSIWSFNPIGHADIHELGHHLQMKRFKRSGNIHTATNTFSFYTKSQYYANEGGHSEEKRSACGPLKFKLFYDIVQKSVNESDPFAHLDEKLWSKGDLYPWYVLPVQAMMHAQKLGTIDNGWHVLARVHILQRASKAAIADWDAKKEDFGFSTYTVDEYKKIGNNDWLVIAYSYAAGVDYRDYYDMLGIPFTQKARDQIESYSFPPAPKSLFVEEEGVGGFCGKDIYGELFERPTLPVDGTSTYDDLP